MKLGDKLKPFRTWAVERSTKWQIYTVKTNLFIQSNGLESGLQVIPSKGAQDQLIFCGKETGVYILRY